jgi:hypothetical protein
MPCMAIPSDGIGCCPMSAGKKGARSRCVWSWATASWAVVTGLVTGAIRPSTLTLARLMTRPPRVERPAPLTRRHVPAGTRAPDGSPIPHRDHSPTLCHCACRLILCIGFRGTGRAARLIHPILGLRACISGSFAQNPLCPRQIVQLGRRCFPHNIRCSKLLRNHTNEATLHLGPIECRTPLRILQGKH